MFPFRWHILDVSVVAFHLFPFTVEHGCPNCFLLPRLLLTMGTVSVMFVFLDASCFFPSCSFHWGHFVNVAFFGMFCWVFPHAFSLGPSGMHVLVWSVEAGTAY